MAREYSNGLADNAVTTTLLSDADRCCRQCHGIQFKDVHVSGSKRGFDVANAYGTTENVSPPLKLMAGPPPPILPAKPSPPGLVDLTLFKSGTDGCKCRIPLRWLSSTNLLDV